MSVGQAQITISSLFDGETPVSLSLRSSGDTLQHNTDQPVPMIAEGWQGGQKLSDQELLALGTLRWYVDHGESPAAEGLTFSVKPSQASHVEVRLEQDGETASGNPVTFIGSGPVKRLGLSLSETEPVETVQLQVEGGNCFVNEGWRQYTATSVMSGNCPLHFETADSQYTFYNLDNAWNCMVYAYEADGTLVGRISGAKRSYSTLKRTSFTAGDGSRNYEAISYVVFRYYNMDSSVKAADIEATNRIMLLHGDYDESIQGQYEPYQTQSFTITLPEAMSAGTVNLLPLLSETISARAWSKALSADAGSLELIAASDALAWAEQSLASIYDGVQGEPGPDGRSSYLHVKYSNDGGQSFTDNQGENLGTWIGTCVDFNQTDPTEVSAYTWKRFADDTELLAELGSYERKMEDYVAELSGSIEAVVHGLGSFTDKYKAQYGVNASGVEGYFELAEAIHRFQSNELNFLASIKGVMRLGWVTDPSTKQWALGLAIGQDLTITADENIKEEGGRQYYELAEGQTFALYTSTGWQFWIKGYRVGWYDSRDGMLHVNEMQSEDSIQFGKESTGYWLMTEDSGFGIRYLEGGN